MLLELARLILLSGHDWWWYSKFARRLIRRRLRWHRRGAQTHSEAHTPSFEAARTESLQIRSEAHTPSFEAARKGRSKLTRRLIRRHLRRHGRSRSKFARRLIHRRLRWGWLANLLLNYRWIFIGRYGLWRRRREHS